MELAVCLAWVLAAWASVWCLARCRLNGLTEVTFGPIDPFAGRNHLPAGAEFYSIVNDDNLSP